jgi:hypothetical protein
VRAQVEHCAQPRATPLAPCPHRAGWCRGLQPQLVITHDCQAPNPRLQALLERPGRSACAPMSNARGFSGSKH